MGLYEFTPEMKEISGFSGFYEECCRKLVKAGMEWLDKHPRAKPKYFTFKNVTGICRPNNRASRRLDKALIDFMNTNPEIDTSVAVHQVVIQTCLWIRKNGWKKYVEVMSK